MIENKILRNTVFAGGVLSLAIGAVGIFLPLLPTTPFVLLAAWCFLNSSEKAHHWIYSHALLGPILRNWENNKSISRKTKIVAILMIASSLALIWWKVTILWVKILVTLILIGSSTFIATRNEVQE